MQSSTRSLISSSGNERAVVAIGCGGENPCEPQAQKFSFYVGLVRTHRIDVAGVERPVEGIGRADGRLRVNDAAAELVEQLQLAGIRADQVKCVNGSRLTDAVDAANAL